MKVEFPDSNTNFQILYQILNTNSTVCKYINSKHHITCKPVYRFKVSTLKGEAGFYFLGKNSYNIR